MALIAHACSIQALVIVDAAPLEDLDLAAGFDEITLHPSELSVNEGLTSSDDHSCDVTRRRFGLGMITHRVQSVHRGYTPVASWSLLSIK